MTPLTPNKFLRFLRLSRVSTERLIEKLASDTLVRLGYVLVEAFEVKEMYPGVENQESQRSGLLLDIMTFSRHGEEFVHFGENLYLLVK